MDVTLHHDPLAPDTDADGKTIDYGQDVGPTELTEEQSDHADALWTKLADEHEGWSDLTEEEKSAVFDKEWQASTDEDGDPFAAPVDLGSLTIPELQKRAEESNVDLTGKKLKADIVAAIEESPTTEEESADVPE